MTIPGASRHLIQKTGVIISFQNNDLSFFQSILLIAVLLMEQCWEITKNLREFAQCEICRALGHCNNFLSFSWYQLIVGYLRVFIFGEFKQFLLTYDLIPIFNQNYFHPSFGLRFTEKGCYSKCIASRSFNLNSAKYASPAVWNLFFYLRLNCHVISMIFGFFGNHCVSFLPVLITDYTAHWHSP